MLRIGLQRTVASGFLALAHGFLAIAYAFPAITRGYPPPPDVRRISIVLYIDSLGPVWQIAFGLTGAVLGFAVLVRHRTLALAHTLGGAAMAVYGSALWIGFALSEPRPTVTGAVAYTGLTIWHLTIGVTYARLNMRPRAVAIPPPPERTRHRRGR